MLGKILKSEILWITIFFLILNFVIDIFFTSISDFYIYIFFLKRNILRSNTECLFKSMKTRNDFKLNLN